MNWVLLWSFVLIVFILNVFHGLDSFLFNDEDTMLYIGKIFAISFYIFGKKDVPAILHKESATVCPSRG